jgi:hypothetical protein
VAGVAMTDYLRAKAGNAALRNVAFGTITGHWLALFSAGPDQTGAGTELTGGGYARQPVTFTGPDASGTWASAAQIKFPNATAAWNVVGVAIMDAATGGHALFWELLASSLLVPIGDYAAVPLGRLTVRVD